MPRRRCGSDDTRLLSTPLICGDQYVNKGDTSVTLVDVRRVLCPLTGDISQPHRSPSPLPPLPANPTRPTTSYPADLPQYVSPPDVLAHFTSAPLTFCSRCVPLAATQPPRYVPPEGTYLFPRTPSDLRRRISVPSIGRWSLPPKPSTPSQPAGKPSQTPQKQVLPTPPDPALKPPTPQPQPQNLTDSRLYPHHILKQPTHSTLSSVNTPNPTRVNAVKTPTQNPSSRTPKPPNCPQHLKNQPSPLRRPHSTPTNTRQPPKNTYG